LPTFETAYAIEGAAFFTGIVDYSSLRHALDEDFTSDLNAVAKSFIASAPPNPAFQELKDTFSGIGKAVEGSFNNVTSFFQQVSDGFKALYNYGKSVFNYFKTFLP